MHRNVATLISDHGWMSTRDMTYQKNTLKSHFKKIHCNTFLRPNATAGKKRDNDYDLYITDQRKYYKDTYTIKNQLYALTMTSAYLLIGEVKCV